MKSILDRSFKYTSAAKTDIRKLFKRVRQQQAAQQQPESNIRPMLKRASK